MQPIFEIFQTNAKKFLAWGLILAAVYVVMQLLVPFAIFQWIKNTLEAQSIPPAYASLFAALALGAALWYGWSAKNIVFGKNSNRRLAVFILGVVVFSNLANLLPGNSVNFSGNGKALKFYTVAEDGRIELSNSPFNSTTGERLLPLTTAIAKKWQKQQVEPRLVQNFCAASRPGSGTDSHLFFLIHADGSFWVFDGPGWWSGVQLEPLYGQNLLWLRSQVHC